MKRISLVFGLMLAVSGFDEIALPGVSAVGGVAPAAGSLGGGGTPTEYLVLGSTMGFEECRARGGIIIRDAGSPLVACDLRRREPVPVGEFDHPGSPVPQTVVVDG